LTVVLSSRRDITLETFRRVAVDGEDVAIGEGARQKMDDARRSFMKLFDSDGTLFISGTMSGGGPRTKVPTPAEYHRKAAERRLVRRSGGVSFGGGDLPDRVVRGIVLCRLTNFLDGHAKSRPIIAERIAQMLDGRSLPKLPYEGQVGGGEILPLAHVLSGLPEGGFEEAESMALLSGSPCSAALVADTALHAPNRVDLSARVFALSIEAFNAPLEAYDPALDELWGDDHEAQALQALRKYLEGVPTEGRRTYQAPVSWRVLPRVLAQAYRASAELMDVARTSISSVTDNPVYLPPDEEHPLGRVILTGGDYNAVASAAMDALGAAWADLCNLADRQTTKLHDGEVSGLPNMLVPPASDSWGTGGLGFVQVGLGERARHAAQRTHIPPSEGGGFGQDDVASATFLAYRKERDAAWCLDAAMAILSVVASQALWVTDRPGPPALADLLAGVRVICPAVDEDGPLRNLGSELERLTDAFQAAALNGAVDFGNGRSLPLAAPTGEAVVAIGEER
jgi:histidine ammonia-lyase